MINNSVSVIGLGHLGLPLAVTFAMSGFTVYAMDIDKEKINSLKNGISPIMETGLQEAISRPEVFKNLIPTTEIELAIKNSSASFLLVNTPSKPDGSYGLQYLEDASKNIGNTIREVDDFHVVVGVSTVSPGDYLNKIVPILEKNSGKKVGTDFGFVHNPEFIALGSVINDMLNPDFRIIGEYDLKSGQIIEDIYKKVSDDPIVRMSVNNAELTKIALNCFLTMKISFANTLGEICDKLEGGDADLVSKALGLDNRISSKFLKAGLGYGGPCFPRDDRAFMALAKKLDTQSFLSEASSKVNDRQVPLALNKIKSIPDVKTITVLGVSFKPNVPYIIDSQAFEITKKLSEDKNYSVTVYDPQALNETKSILQDTVNYAENLDQAILAKSDLTLILTPWKEFGDVDFKGKRVLSFW
jgi:UDPglucose 6-dehydrogenase